MTIFFEHKTYTSVQAFDHDVGYIIPYGIWEDWRGNEWIEMRNKNG